MQQGFCKKSKGKTNNKSLKQSHKQRGIISQNAPTTTNQYVKPGTTLRKKETNFGKGSGFFKNHAPYYQARASTNQPSLFLAVDPTKIKFLPRTSSISPPFPYIRSPPPSLSKLSHVIACASARREGIETDAWAAFLDRPHEQTPLKSGGASGQLLMACWPRL